MKDSIMKTKHTRRELRDEDYNKVIAEAIRDYKEDYEFTLHGLIRGKIDHYDQYLFSEEGPRLDALRFYEKNIDNA